MRYYTRTVVHGDIVAVKTLTQCDVAATEQIVMIPPLRMILSGLVDSMIVVWFCVYIAVVTIRVPVDSDTARVKFTRLLTVHQCGGSWMSRVAVCKCIPTHVPLGPAVDVR